MVRLFGALAALAVLLGSPALSQGYPSKPVRILVPYSPGGATDIVARILADKLRETLGQSFVVENKPGAFGIVAIEEVARAQPDGHTLMVGNVSTNAITPLIYKDKLKFDYEKSITPVARLAVIPALIAASTSTEIKIKSLPELVEYGRKHPGRLNYTSAGVGSYPHYDAALFARRAGFESVHVPTRAGAAGMITDMMTGQVHWGFINAASSLPMIQAGHLTPLATITDKRMPELPNVPTVAELGYPGAGTFNWQGLFASAGTPPAVLEALSKAVVEAVGSPGVKAAFEKASISADPTMSLDEARRWMDREVALWRKTTTESGVVVN